MSPDILGALVATAPTRNTDVCKLQAVVDAIPEGTEGRAELVEAVNDPKAYPAHYLVKVFHRLGTPVGENLVRHHRAKRCVCWR